MVDIHEEEAVNAREFRLPPSVIAAAIWLAAAVSPGGAENIVFPPNCGVVDITKAPYYADNTGKTDVSAILTRALAEERATGSWLSKIVYLPNGTYLVCGAVKQKEPPYTVGPHLQGQSRERTVIRLADGTWPAITGLRYVLSTGNGVAQCFNRGVRNLTVSVGRDNAGASGIWWYGNNAALLSDVNVVSEDGKGVIGLDAGTGESGPSMVRNLYVKGFDIGVQSSAIYAVTFFNIRLENQNRLGILTRTINCPAWFDSVVSVNRVTAFRAEGGSKVVLVDAVLSGGADTCEAIWNYSGARLFSRNVRASGYRGMLYCPSTIQPAEKMPQGLYIGEFSSHKSTSLFDSSPQSLNIPRKVPPEPAWEQDLSKWAVCSQYMSGRSAGQALQAAIDDQSKTAVAVDREFTIDQPVYVRNNIKLIIGTVTRIGGGRIIVADGNAPVVKIQNIDGPVTIHQQSSRTLVLESNTSDAYAEAGGDLFITDHVAQLYVTSPQARVWAWHFNSEGSGVHMSGGTVRIFGWKTEHDGTKVHATGGTLEILGFLMYAPCGAKSTPLMSVANTDFSCAMMSQFTFCDGALYEHLIHETRGSVTKDLFASDNYMGYDLPLYLAHNREPQVTAMPEVVPHVAAGARRNRLVVLRHGASSTGVRTRALNRLVYDTRGRREPAGTRGAARPAVDGVYIVDTPPKRRAVR